VLTLALAPAATAGAAKPEKGKHSGALVAPRNAITFKSAKKVSKLTINAPECGGSPAYATTAG
jgi:hypothetical protein